MEQTTTTTKTLVGRPPLDPSEVFETSAAFRCHVVEKEFLKQQAAASGLRLGPYCRARSLGIPTKQAGVKIDPEDIETLINTLKDRPSSGGSTVIPDGLLHELSQLSRRFADVGNLANQLARDVHTDRSFTHDWREVRDGIQETRQSIVALLDKIGVLLGD